MRVVWRRLAPGNAIAGPRSSGRVSAVSPRLPENCPPGCVFVRRGHRRCLYPAAREHSGPVGGSAALVGPRPPPGGWVRGRWGSGRISARQGHRRCLYPGVREHTGPAGVAAGVRAGALERPGWGCGSGPLLSSRPARWSSGCVFARRGHRRCLYPAAPGTCAPGRAGVTAGARAGALERPGWGCGSGPLLSSCPARSLVQPGPAAAGELSAGSCIRPAGP